MRNWIKLIYDVEMFIVKNDVSVHAGRIFNLQWTPIIKELSKLSLKV